MGQVCSRKSMINIFDVEFDLNGTNDYIKEKVDKIVGVLLTKHKNVFEHIKDVRLLSKFITDNKTLGHRKRILVELLFIRIETRLLDYHINNINIALNYSN